MSAQTSSTRPVTIPMALTVKELGDLLTVSPVEVIKRLMTNGVMASMNQTIDYETAAVVAVELGWDPQEEEAVETAPAPPPVEEEEADDPAKLQERPPVVTILGHVDHGKTSLLDAIRKTRVAEGEAGGITQHVGAYQVVRDGKKITFIDTPGHAAFTAMRARGAQVTDIAVLVVAADDGVMPQTIEAISHAQAAGVPMIVAINKIDLPGANPDRIKQQLTEHNVVVEDYGGDIVTVPVSATKGTGIDDLLESINLVAEISELKANPDRPALAVVVEAEMDSSRGPLATLLVKNGTLRQGDAIVAGEISGRVKAMFDDRGERIREAGPSAPVVVMGLEEVPEAGERVRVIADEKTARQLVEERRRAREASEQTAHAHVNLDSLFNEISAGKLKELIIVLKADVRGSAEAIRAAVERLSTSEVKVKVIHSSTGNVNDSDVMLAEASNGLILAFNTKVDPSARKRSDATGVDIRSYGIIYQLLEDIEKALAGMYEPVFNVVIDGHAEVRQVFKSSRVGGIAGCYVTDGTIRRGLHVRVLRGGQEMAKGRCEGLKRFQDDVREVQTGYECGVVVSGFEKFAEGDVLEFFHEERAN
ncbi:MAG: translation initiation factor IF-2 [Chloroflexi bacterium CFX7]|nr:MAG: translation initiation factor IF-2 [bacterium]MCE7927460.1 translation initiation factor IF-2 [Chloroflexi bacterium CFX7]MCK6565616.1 translation initiation factor IF-2 [Dehalococcoidia bacterium]MCL4230826.1 translation initiation factor IF-2 [Dehalococcoidia bacterium]RIL04124.1 MAG: translation initiation factor IF-2 [bacterium]